MMIYVENNYQIKCHIEVSNTKRILKMCGVVLTSIV
jgi:regulation of enolase protein 1 (concanavalin A-like superfamily)